MFRMFPRKLQKLFTVQAYQELALKTSRLLDSLGVYDDDIGHRLVILHFLIRKRRRSCILHRARFLHVWYALESLTALLQLESSTSADFVGWSRHLSFLMRVQFRGAKSEGHFHHSIFSRTNFLLKYFVLLRCIIIFVSHKIGTSLIKKINILLYMHVYLL